MIFFTTPYLFGRALRRTESYRRVLRCAGVVRKQDGSVMGDMHAFPTVEQLQDITEEDLRNNGFGYRAAYIAETASLLHEKPSETDRTGSCCCQTLHDSVSVFFDTVGTLEPVSRGSVYSRIDICATHSWPSCSTDTCVQEEGESGY